MQRGAWARTCMAVLGVASGWGCAANPAATPAPAAPPVKEESREPTTIEEAQAQLERARAQLPGPPSSGSTTATTGAAVESAPAGGATATTESPPPSRCGNACGAMSSMRRAVDAICRMAGEADARCSDARRTLKDSETKVAGCGCPPG